MTPITLALLIFGIMLLLMVIRVPIAGAMFLAGAAGFILQTGASPFLNFLNNLAFARLANYDLSVIPLFILMGHFATQGGISKALFQFAAAVMGRFKGGLAMGAVLACAAFGAICGSSVATAATFSRVAYPEMRRFGYPTSFATGVIAAGGTLGAMLPPSTVLAVYAILTQQDIGKLFMAGILPGLLAMLMYVLTIVVIVRVRPQWLPAGDRKPWAERAQDLRAVWAPLVLFIFVIGGLYGGMFTPTEAGGVGARAIAMGEAYAAVADLVQFWQSRSHLHPLWQRIADFVARDGDAPAWEDLLRLADGRLLCCEVKPLAGGATMTTFRLPSEQGEQLPRITGLKRPA